MNNNGFLKNKKSFSLFELIVVVAMVVILFTITIPKMFFVNRFLVENEVDKMFAIFSFLQQRAIASNQEQAVIFDLSQNTYFYGLSDGSRRNLEDCPSPRTEAVELKNGSNPITCKLPDAVKFGFFQGAKGPPSFPNKPITSPITFKNMGDGKFKVTFFSDGKVQPGTVYFVDKNRNFMMALTCPISQVSFIRKYKYNQGKWVCLK